MAIRLTVFHQHHLIHSASVWKVIFMIAFNASHILCLDSQIASPNLTTDPIGVLRRASPTKFLPEGRNPPVSLSDQNLSTADQLFADSSAYYPLERQIPIPPSPTTTVTTTTTEPPSALDILQALLPIIALASPMLGGHSVEDFGIGFGSGSWEHGMGLSPSRLLPALLGPALTLSNLPMSSPFLRLPPPLGQSARPTAADPTQTQQGPPSEVVQVRCTGARSPICEDAPFDKILSINENIIGIKGNHVYNIQSDGTPHDPKPSGLDPLLDGLTATLNMAGSEYVFQGDQYYKYNDGVKEGTAMLSRQVSSGFPGLPASIDGAFRVNNDTYVFISGTKFYYYQPDANPPVNPQFSPQQLTAIIGAPPSVDSVFYLKKRPVLYHEGMLYELDPAKMKIRRKIPLKTPDGRGWLKCTDEKTENCVEVKVPALTTDNSQPAPKRNPFFRSTAQVP